MFNRKYFIVLLIALYTAFACSSLLNASDDSIAYWKLNEGTGTTVSDKSSNSNDGTIYGAVWIENELDFDGVDDYVSIPDDNSLDVTDEITILVWVKPYSFTDNSYGGIIHKGYSGDPAQATAYGLCVNYSTDQPRFFLSTADGYGQSLIGNSSLLIDKWQHIAVTYKSGDARIYRNGFLDASTTSITGAISTSTNSLTIGKRSSFYFDGQMGEMAIYDKVLTEQEIKEYCEQGGHWSMNEGSGTVSADESSNINSGTIYGASWVTGDTERGTVLDLDGVDDYVNIPDSSGLDASDEITILAWVKPHSFVNSSYEGIVHKRYYGDLAQKTSYGLCVNYSTAHPRFFLSTDDGYGKSLTANTPLVSNQWQHIAVTYKSGDARIYRNGSPDGSTTSITGTISTSSDPVTIGKRHSFYFDGEIDEIVIYKRVLTEYEIKEAYSQVGCWSMDKGSGTTISDKSLSMNDGTITGATWVSDDSERGTVLEFDGVADYVSIPDSPSLDARDELTILAWVKPYSFNNSSYEGIVHKSYSGDPAQKTSYGLCVNYNNARPRFFLSTDNAYGQSLTANTSLVSYQWQHIAVTYKSGDARIYRNGSSDGSTTSITGTISTSSDPVTIGKRHSFYFNGEIDEVRIYSKVLSADEIECIYDNYYASVYIVSPISDNKILPDSFISEGLISDEISIRACPGEYYPASFAVKAHKDIDDMTVTAGNLISGTNSISSSNINIRVVKCWYQWPGKYLTPELLLKDDSLVKIENGENYLYVDNEYVLISDPDGIPDIPAVPTIADFPVQDSATLQVVDIAKGNNKQFWITVNVPDTAVAGNYEGTITLANTNGTIRELTLKLEVLPITLLEPDVVYSIYHSSKLKDNSADGTITRNDKNSTQYAAELANLFSHGVTNPNVYGGHDDLGDALTMRNNAGMGSQPLYYLGLQFQYYTDMNVLKAAVTSTITTVTSYGVTDLYCYGPDEQPLDTTLNRNRMTAVHDAGGKVFNAQRAEYADDVDDILDLAIVSSMDSTLAASYHSSSNKIGAYANPQAGLERPDTYRRNYGLLVWQKDYDVVMDWAYQGGHNHIWNDFDHSTYRDECFTYPTIDGVIDTIEWEGFRAGVDDMRYLATLSDLADNAGTEGQAARDWLDDLKNMDLAGVDLDKIRSKMIKFILELND
jgi:Concanavalin A-like lectin/glucanases superfamily